MKEIILLMIVVMVGLFGPPTVGEDADAAWLANKIYEGVYTMNTDSGYVFHSHDSTQWGAYALWKQKKSGECYIVIRGTKTISDVFTDLDVEEIYDEEIQVGVHRGVKRRADFIFGDIDDKLKICNEDIIVTGHSLGGSIAYYLYLKYVYYHMYKWGQSSKAFKFKADLFSAPALTTKSNDKTLLLFDHFVNWFKYGSDPIPFIIAKAKSSILFEILNNLLSNLGIIIHKKAYNIIKTISYGNYHPGNKYHLKNGERRDYSSDIGVWNANGIRDHMDFYKAVEILTRVW